MGVLFDVRLWVSYFARMFYLVQKWQKGGGCAYILVMKYLAQILLVIFISGCSDSLEKQTSELVNAKYKWLEAVGNNDYSYNYTRQCLCAFSGKDILIIVKNNKITSATSEGIELPTKSFSTIKGHFLKVLELLKTQENENRETFEVEYDSTYGYPKMLYTKMTPHIFDTNSTEYLSKFSLLK